MDEYLTTQELSDRIKLTPASIRNKVCRGDFKLGVHYVKAGHRKLLFIWSAIEDWLYAGAGSKISTRQQKGLINI